MAQKDFKSKKGKKENEPPAIKPDPETLGKTDPQEHMKGPISSMVKKAETAMDKNDEEDKGADSQD